MHWQVNEANAIVLSSVWWVEAKIKIDQLLPIGGVPDGAKGLNRDLKVNLDRTIARDIFTGGEKGTRFGRQDKEDYAKKAGQEDQGGSLCTGMPDEKRGVAIVLHCRRGHQREQRLRVYWQADVQRGAQELGGWLKWVIGNTTKRIHRGASMRVVQTKKTGSVWQRGSQRLFFGTGREGVRLALWQQYGKQSCGFLINCSRAWGKLTWNAKEVKTAPCQLTAKKQAKFLKSTGGNHEPIWE